MYLVNRPGSLRCSGKTTTVASRNRAQAGTWELEVAVFQATSGNVPALTFSLRLPEIIKHELYLLSRVLTLGLFGHTPGIPWELLTTVGNRREICSSLWRYSGILRRYAGQISEIFGGGLTMTGNSWEMC